MVTDNLGNTNPYIYYNNVNPTTKYDSYGRLKGAPAITDQFATTAAHSIPVVGSFIGAADNISQPLKATNTTAGDVSSTLITPYHQAITDFANLGNKDHTTIQKFGDFGKGFVDLFSPEFAAIQSAMQGKQRRGEAAAWATGQPYRNGAGYKYGLDSNGINYASRMRPVEAYQSTNPHPEIAAAINGLGASAGNLLKQFLSRPKENRSIPTSGANPDGNGILNTQTTGSGDVPYKDMTGAPYADNANTIIPPYTGDSQFPTDNSFSSTNQGIDSTVGIQGFGGASDTFDAASVFQSGAGATDFPTDVPSVTEGLHKGGKVTAYRDGGIANTKSPIITHDPNDPRLRAYNDSLKRYDSSVNLYNIYKNANPNIEPKRIDLDSDSKFLYSVLGEAIPSYEFSFKKAGKGVHGKDEMFDAVKVGFYEKPVQPYQYQHEQIRPDWFTRDRQDGELGSKEYFDKKTGKPYAFHSGGSTVVEGGKGDDDIALVDANTGRDTKIRVEKGEMIVFSKDNVDAIKEAVKSGDHHKLFTLVADQLQQKGQKKDGTLNHAEGGPLDINDFKKKYQDIRNLASDDVSASDIDKQIAEIKRKYPDYFSQNMSHSIFGETPKEQIADLERTKQEIQTGGKKYYDTPSKEGEFRQPAPVQMPPATLHPIVQAALSAKHQNGTPMAKQLPNGKVVTVDPNGAIVGSMNGPEEAGFDLNGNPLGPYNPATATTQPKISLTSKTTNTPIEDPQNKFDYGGAFNYGADAAKYILGAAGAETPLPNWQVPQSWVEYSNEARHRSGQGLSAAEKAMAQNNADNTYRTNLEVNRNIAGGNAGLIIAGNNMANINHNNAALQLASADAAANRANFSAYAPVVSQDLTNSRTMYNDQNDRAMWTKQSGAALMNKAADDASQQALTDKYYGNGSDYQELLNLTKQKSQAEINALNSNQNLWLQRQNPTPQVQNNDGSWGPQNKKRIPVMDSNGNVTSYIEQ